MARRRRLSPADPDRAAATPAAAGAPIARETGDAAEASALAEVSTAYESARREGRLAQALPLEAVAADHLIRDRLAAEDAEMAALVASLRARGQQTPIEVADLGGGRYGLISGWRRLTALARLHAETGEERFATALAFVRTPETAADAYLAMVEENEVRVGLSHFERARIVARAVEVGVYPDTRTALRGLFASASRARRSKIGAFLAIVEALGAQLRFPAAIPERLGLALARALEADPALGPRIESRLAEAAPQSAEAEAKVLAAALSAAKPASTTSTSATGPAEPWAPKGRPAPGVALPASEASAAPPPYALVEIAPGIRVQERDDHVAISGPGVDAAFRARLRAWLAGGEG